MKRSRLIAPATALALLASVAMPAFAQTATGTAQTDGTSGQQATAPSQTTAPQASPSQGDQSQPSGMMPFQLSQDAAFGLREVQIAHAALQAGDMKAAQTLLSEAKSRFEAADAQAITLDKLPSKKDQSVPEGKYFPVGAQTMIREDLSAQPAKQQAVQEASEQVKSGDHEGARETLRVNEIDMATVVALLPQDKTMQALDQAIELLGQDKADEAGQALSSLEQGMIVEGMGLTGVPKSEASQASGEQGSGVTQSSTSTPAATSTPATAPEAKKN